MCGARAGGGSRAAGACKGRMSAVAAVPAQFRRWGVDKVMGVLERAEATSGMPIASPPSDTLLMSYPVVGSQTRWMLHHAAPFAAARWTNVFDPARFMVSR